MASKKTTSLEGNQNMANKEKKLHTSNLYNRPKSKQYTLLI